MINSLSLFSGYGGIDLALAEYCKPVLYCEKDKYAQGIILSRMDDGALPFAPIWDDVTTLDGAKFRGLVDIIVGGFPCQDISVAGKGAGLAGERSGLFYEICRIAREAETPFIFLENVPAIQTRGAEQVQEALASMGYASRWGHLSAAEVGANHKRERWFCLASNANSIRGRLQQKQWKERKDSPKFINDGSQEYLAHPLREGLQEYPWREIQAKMGFEQAWPDGLQRIPNSSEWWEIEPNVGRVVDGLAFRLDRIKALGNGVVPLQVKTAFKILVGKK